MLSDFWVISDFIIFSCTTYIAKKEKDQQRLNRERQRLIEYEQNSKKKLSEQVTPIEFCIDDPKKCSTFVVKSNKQ